MLTNSICPCRCTYGEEVAGRHRHLARVTMGQGVLESSLLSCSGTQFRSSEIHWGKVDPKSRLDGGDGSGSERQGVDLGRLTDTAQAEPFCLTDSRFVYFSAAPSSASCRYGGVSWFRSRSAIYLLRRTEVHTARFLEWLLLDTNDLLSANESYLVGLLSLDIDPPIADRFLFTRQPRRFW